MMPNSTPPTSQIALRYRIGFLVLMLASGLLLTLIGPVLIIGSIVVFRPAASFLGILLTLAGIRNLRRYAAAFFRRQAAYQFDDEGIHYIAQKSSTRLWFTNLKIPISYVIPWSTILGIHVVRQSGREATDMYFYLSDNPFSSLFWGEVDPRAALFGSHRPESPNQLHLRLSQFDVTHLSNDFETAIRNFAPRMGAFPTNAKILLGHLAAMNTMVFALGMTFIFGVILAIIVSLATAWPLGLLAFAIFQCLALLVPVIRWLKQRSPAWETPRLITVDGTLYIPGATLGKVKIADILNVRYGLTGLRFIFKSCQDAVQDSRYNPYGLIANVMILTREKPRPQLRNYFSDDNIWDNGKKPDIQKAKEQKKREDEKSRLEIAKLKQHEAEQALKDQAKLQRQKRRPE